MRLEVGRRRVGRPSQQFVIREGPSFYVVPNRQPKIAEAFSLKRPVRSASAAGATCRSSVESGPKRSSLVTATTSSALSPAISFASCGRSARAALTFSIVPAPAALSASIWPVKFWSRVETLA